MADTLCDNPAQAPAGDDLERMKKAEDVIGEASLYFIRPDLMHGLLSFSFQLLILDCLNEPFHAGCRKGLSGRGR